MKSWLRTQLGVESAFMSGSGSTMVAIIAPDAQEESVTVLKEKLTLEFGPELWIHETTFLNG
jgi:4-diphosphocytidyl-2C-methyl-D-erythritol kinase